MVTSTRKMSGAQWLTLLLIYIPSSKMIVILIKANQGKRASWGMLTSQVSVYVHFSNLFTLCMSSVMILLLR